MTDASPIVAKADSPETQRYNRIHRWLEITDFLIGLAFLVLLLATDWTSTLRDWAYRSAGQHYALAVFFYITMLLAISKVLGFGLDYYGFRIEHRYNLSNQSIRSWLWDQAKTWLHFLIFPRNAAGHQRRSRPKGRSRTASRPLASSRRSFSGVGVISLSPESGFRMRTG